MAGARVRRGEKSAFAGTVSRPPKAPAPARKGEPSQFPGGGRPARRWRSSDSPPRDDGGRQTLRARRGPERSLRQAISQRPQNRGVDPLRVSVHEPCTNVTGLSLA
jgi:hypothetical protein